MSLRSVDVKIDDGSRDDGKVFRITEMNADAAEWWALRVGGLVMEADKNNELLGLAFGGMDALAELGPVLIMKFALASDPDRLKPLLAEMEKCWSIVNPANPTSSMPLANNSIEEVSTRLRLRKETLELFFSFFTKKAAPNSKA